MYNFNDPLTVAGAIILVIYVVAMAITMLVGDRASRLK